MLPDVAYMSVPPDQVRRISLTCRCGKKQIVYIPQPVAHCVNIHSCTCGTLYELQQQPDKKWRIQRSEIDQDVFVQSTPPASFTKQTPAAEKKLCPFCDGVGQIAGSSCVKCGGSGRKKGTVN